jgi:hypothetical protein
MPDVASNPRPKAPRNRYRVIDPETAGVYLVVTAQPQSDGDVQDIVAGVIRDEGRVARGLTRLILI